MTNHDTKTAVYAVATMDTKGEEIAFVADVIRAAGHHVRTVDVGTLGPPKASPQISQQEVMAAVGLACHSQDRGEAVTEMGNALRAFLLDEQRQGRVTGVIGIGGSGGTALITRAMRALDIGLPKLMVSTVASGNMEPYIDCSDIMMMYSVVDVAGLNEVSRQVLGNAANAMAGMVNHPLVVAKTTETVAATMFGVTTPCVDRVRQSMESQGVDCLVFHATGTGGRAMERLVESGFVKGVIDATTTEVADEVVGGIFPCGASRFDRLIAAKIPLVVSLGAVDMVNFGALDSVPPQFADRNLHVHNAQVTLMRTDEDENRAIASWISSKLNRAESPVTVVVPESGVSMLDAPGQPFYDPKADQTLFEELGRTLQCDETRRIVRMPLHINDPAFSDALVAEYNRLTQS